MADKIHTSNNYGDINVGGNAIVTIGNDHRQSTCQIHIENAHLQGEPDLPFLAEQVARYIASNGSQSPAIVAPQQRRNRPRRRNQQPKHPQGPNEALLGPGLDHFQTGTASHRALMQDGTDGMRVYNAAEAKQFFVLGRIFSTAIYERPRWELPGTNNTPPGDIEKPYRIFTGPHGHTMVSYIRNWLTVKLREDCVMAVPITTRSFDLDNTTCSAEGQAVIGEPMPGYCVTVTLEPHARTLNRKYLQLTKTQHFRPSDPTKSMGIVRELKGVERLVGCLQSMSSVAPGAGTAILLSQDHWEEKYCAMKSNGSSWC